MSLAIMSTSDMQNDPQKQTMVACGFQDTHRGCQVFPLEGEQDILHTISNV